MLLDMTAELEHSMRCPHCGGFNDLDAQWCMQCYARLTQETPSGGSSRARPEAAPRRGPSLDDALAATLDLVAGRDRDEDEGALGSAFTVVGKSVTWSCSACGHLNDVKTAECSECGRPFKDSVHSFAIADLPRKQSASMWKAFSYITIGLVVMRWVADLISPWAALAVLGGATLRFLYKYFLR